MKYFLRSFKNIGFNYIYVILFDLLFWLVAIVGYSFLSDVIVKGFKGASLSMQAIQAVTKPEEFTSIQDHYQVLNGFVQSSILYIVLFVALLFVVWCIMRAFIWAIILKKDVNFKFVKRFVLLNLAWQPFNLFIFVLISLIFLLFGLLIKNLKNFGSVWIFVLNLTLLVCIMFPLGLWIMSLTNTLYIEFCKKGKIKLALKKMIENAILNFKKLYVNFFYMSVVFAVLSFVILPVKHIGHNAYLISSLVAMIVFFTWNKFYLVDLVR